MPNFNKVIVCGNLVADPELKTLGSGRSVVSFRMAVNESYKDKDGNRQERTDFFDGEMWGKQAETFAKFLKKGRGVLIEGKLKQDTWKDKDSGDNRSKVVIAASNFTFMDSKGSNEGGGGSGQNTAPVAMSTTAEDIPF